MRKKVAFTPRWARPSSRAVVVERRGPSSKVRAMSLGLWATSAAASAGTAGLARKHSRQYHSQGRVSASKSVRAGSAALTSVTILFMDIRRLSPPL